MLEFYRLIKPDWARPVLDNGEPNPKFVKEIPGADVLEGCYDQAFLTQKNAEGYSVYFFPNKPNKNVYEEGVRHLSGKHIENFSFLFVDMDLKDKIYASKEDFLNKISEFPLKPTMTVDSGNGIHAYWEVTDLNREAYVFGQLALMNHFKTDESVFTVLQLMRLPGSTNTKKLENFVPCECLAEYSSYGSYTIGQFPENLFLIPDKAAVRGQRHLDKLDGKIKVDIPFQANLEELPDSFLEFIEDPKNKYAHDLFRAPKETCGDRSKADMKLANILMKADFNKKDALAVISNTDKALSKGAYRFTYAAGTIDKVYAQKLSTKFKTVGESIRTGVHTENLAETINSSFYFDQGVLGNPWRKKEVIGLIAGPGVGKTSVTLKWMKDSIENNPHNDDVFVFFSLEMTESEIIERWIKLVGETSPLADRLYVVGNEDDKGEPRNLGLQEMLEIGNEIKKLTGKQIRITAIDHVGLISKHIDSKKKYTFGIQSETDAGWGDIKTLSMNSLATQIKTLAKLLDTLIVVLTQTTKEKGIGDIPIGKDGAYGISQYENIMDRIITIWQPLQRVQSRTNTRFLAWQYAKIRSQSDKDKVQCLQPKLLTFDLRTGDLNLTTPDEYQEFLRLVTMANEMRANEVKTKGGSTNYSLHVNLEALNKTLSNIKTGAAS